MSIPTAWKIAGGRRRYNAQRRRARDDRRELVRAALLATETPCMIDHGWASALARELGVHHSQISRDLAVIRPALTLPDPCCPWHARQRARQQGHAYEMERLERELAALRAGRRWR